MASADGAPRRRLPRAGRPAPRAREALLPLPRPRRLRTLPGWPRLPEARRQDAAPRLLRAVEPAAVPPRRALHRPRPVAGRVQVVPGQPGALPAQSGRVRTVRRGGVAVAGALLLASCGSGGSSSPADGSGGSASPPHSVATGPQTLEPDPPSSSDTSAGSAEHPVAAAPEVHVLQWKRVAGSTDDLVTVGEGWTLT